MSDLKISPDVFLGVQELNRLKKSIKDDGFQFFIKSLLESYGVIYNKFLDPNFNFLKVSGGNSSNTIVVNTGYAYDMNGNVIFKKDDGSTINVFTADVWLWVKIKQAFSTIEKNKVSIGGLNSAMMTTINGNFTEILRGQPDYPSKIKFTNSTRYTLEYEVLEVIDDNNAIIQGVFDVVETDLTFTVIGTFTPGYSANDSDKEIFMYDDCDIELVEETTLNQPPAILQNQEFLLARIMNSTTNGMIIQDKRSMNICKTRSENTAYNVSQTNNLIAVESVKKFINQANTFFIINFDWKLNILAETRNYQQNSVSISNGSGGKYKTTADFTDNSFDGWKYYYEDGTFNTVLKSVKNSGNIDLYLDELKEDMIGIFVAPDCNEIAVTALIKDSTDTTILYKKQYLFNVNSSNPTINLPASEIFKAGGQVVELLYMHKKMNNTNTEQNMNMNTYYTEQAFTAGVLTDPTKTLTDISPTIGITL